MTSKHLLLNPLLFLLLKSPVLFSISLAWRRFHHHLAKLHDIQDGAESVGCWHPSQLLGFLENQVGLGREAQFGRVWTGMVAADGGFLLHVHSLLQTATSRKASCRPASHARPSARSIRARQRSLPRIASVSNRPKPTALPVTATRSAW